MRTRTPWSLPVALVLLTGLFGCADFEEAGAAFCQRNPQRCGYEETAPVLVESSQSTIRALASDAVTFRVTAEEAASPLEFSWTSTSGTLGEPSTTGTSSQVTWTPPPCSPADSVVTVSATLKTRGGLSTSKVFTLSTNPCPVPTLSTSGKHSLALRADGTVWAWGNNEEGELGDGTTTERSQPVRVSGLDSVTAISAGPAYSLALRADGTVWAWGSNTKGQLGDASVTQRLTPVQVSGLTGVTAILTGSTLLDAYSLALRGDGTVWAWGSNVYGQLGDGTTKQRLAPVQVSGLSDITSIVTGRHDSNSYRFMERAGYSLALRRDGTVWAWGSNAAGQLGDGTYNYRTAPVQVSGLTGITAIVAGKVSPYWVSHSTYALALRNDGTVWAWGSNAFGQLGDGTMNSRVAPVQVSGLTGVTAIAAGSMSAGHSLALRGDGTVWAWGSNRTGQLGDGTTNDRLAPVQVSGLSGVTTLAMGTVYSLALRRDGTVWAWGSNQQGELGDGTTNDRLAPVQVSGLTGVTFIATGTLGPSYTQGRSTSGDYALALRGDGSVWAWGSNESRQLGRGLTGRRSTPGQASNLTNVSSLAAGQRHSLALRRDGTVWAWGSNQEGALGDGMTSPQFNPKQVPGLTSVMALSSRGTSSLALRNNGTVWAWGSNTYGQLGDGTKTERSPPVQVPGLFDVISIATGGSTSYFANNYSLALRNNGMVWAWGNNGSGQLGDGTTTERLFPTQVSGLTGVTSIAAGGDFTMALRGDGTVWAWGSNSQGQLGDGTTTTTARSTPLQVPSLTNVIAIATGTYHAMALRGDGTVWTWGHNSSGQLGHGTTISRYSPVQVPGLTQVTSIVSAGDHSLALRNDGTVWAWGSNGSGQLGEGTLTDRNAPVKVSGLAGVTALAASRDYSVALRNDGTVWAWGSNDSGQLGDGTASYSPVAVQALRP